MNILAYVASIRNVLLPKPHGVTQVDLFSPIFYTKLQWGFVFCQPYTPFLCPLRAAIKTTFLTPLFNTSYPPHTFTPPGPMVYIYPTHRLAITTCHLYALISIFKYRNYVLYHSICDEQGHVCQSQTIQSILWYK